MNLKSSSVTTTRFVVTYGQVKEENRSSRTFVDSKSASDFFTEKLKAGFHCDAYEVRETHDRVVTKLS